MKLPGRITFVALSALMIVGVQAVAQTPPPAAAPARRGFAQDPRAQTRTYHFEDTNEDQPYSLYVSSKVKKDQKAPLIVTLHGLGAPQTIMMGAAAIDLAEEGGYILVAPMGYNISGWYGSPAFAPGAGGGRGRGTPGAGAPGRAPRPPAVNQPANLRELSEKDVMNVIGFVRKEFNVDDKRMYIMGHSMGGAGALYLGSKYANLFAAVGAEAPAAFWQTRKETLQPMRDAGVPVMIVHGDIDEVVPVANSHAWVDAMKELDMQYEFVEQPGITHGPVIQSGLKPIYAFFAKHQK
jgi:predicted peptidase